MKQNWQIKKLGEVCDLLNGYSFKSSQYVNEGIRIIRITNVQNGFIVDDDPKFYSVETKELIQDYILNDGDLLLSLTGNCGRVGIITKEFLPAALNQRVACLRISDKTISKAFLFYLLNNKAFEKKCMDEATGAAQKNMSTEWLKKQEFSFPPLEEQNRIVSVLDKKVAQIETLKNAAEKSLQNAKQLFQAELEKAFSNTSWEKKTLDEVCAITSKLVDPTQPEYLDLYHVGGANIESETGIIIDLKTSKEERLSSGKFTFNESMVLYNKIRPYLKKVTRPDFSGLCSADMYPLNPKENITKDYLYYILISDNFTEYAISKSGRAGMPKVNREALFAYECYLPPLEEQKRIVAHLDSLNEKVHQLEEIYTKQLADCDELKQSLLQKAFEGEL